MFTGTKTITTHGPWTTEPKSGWSTKVRDPWGVSGGSVLDTFL